MKRIITIILILMMIAAFFAGCASPASSTVTPTPSDTPVLTPSETTLPEPSPSPTADEKLGSKMKTYKEMTYYLDDKDAVAADYDEDPPLRRKNTGGDGEAGELGIRGFNFDIIGDYIYVDSLDPDLDGNGIRTWSTTRMNPDGSGKTKLEYGSMSPRHVKDDAKKFYFTAMGESAVYVSDYTCENVVALIINLPDKSELDKKLGAEKTLQLDINDVKDGQINFTATFSTEEGIELYNGTYKISEDGKTIKKEKGNYIDNSQESEAD